MRRRGKCGENSSPGDPLVGLDTTFLSDVLRQQEAALDLLRGLVGSQERHVTTALNAAELLNGAAASRQGERKFEKIQELLDGIVVLPFNRESSVIFGEITRKLAREGSAAPLLDLMIAAALLAHGETRIVTRNVRDFERVPGLIVLSY